MKSRIKTILGNIVLCLMTICLCFFLLEISLRVLLPCTNMITLKKNLYRKDEIVGHTLKPNIKVHEKTDEYRTTIKSNSDGLRNDKDYKKGPHPDSIRILGLGDSFTFGHGVNIEDTYLKILEGKLNNETPRRGVEFEVINAAFPGWGIAQEFLFLKSEGIKYKPDLVIIGFINDDIFRNIHYYDLIANKDHKETAGRNKAIAQPKTNLIVKIKEYALVHTRTYPFLASKISQIPWLNNLCYRIGLREKTNPYFRDETYTAQSISRAKDIFVHFRDICSESGIQLLVVNIPIDYKTRDQANDIDRIMFRFFHENDILAIDVTESFLNASEQLYFLRDRHPNPKGHEVIAYTILDGLNEHGIIAALIAQHQRSHKKES